MKDQNSRFYPCNELVGGDWCGGIAALVNQRFTCGRCGKQWDENGNPVIKQ